MDRKLSPSDAVAICAFGPGSSWLALVAGFAYARRVWMVLCSVWVDSYRNTQHSYINARGDATRDALMFRSSHNKPGVLQG